MGWFEERFSEAPKRLRFDCVQCGRAMWFPPSKHGKYVTCGGECAAARFHSMKAVRQRPCETCGNEFIPRPTEAGKGERRFCCMQCALPHVRAIGHTKEANAKRAATMAALRAEGKVRILRGEENPSWKGGKEAAKLRQQLSGKRAAITRAYRAANRDKVREFSLRRKSRKYGRLPYGTIPKLRKLQRDKCAICRVKLPKHYHIDHIEPLARGGKHERRNLQLLCPPCNVRKSAKDPIAYMQERGFLL